MVPVKRLRKKRNDTIEKTNTNLTFYVPSLPTHIKVGMYQMKIYMFIPNPLRCFKYVSGLVMDKQHVGLNICFKCGEERPDGKGCQKNQKCKNCKADHMAFSKQCPIWIKVNKRPTGLNRHLSIRDFIYTEFLSEGCIFAYQQPHYYNK